MIASNQFHAPAALPSREKTQVPIGGLVGHRAPLDV